MKELIRQDIDRLPEILQEAMQLSLRYLQHLDAGPTAVIQPQIDWPALPWEGLGAKGTQHLFEQVFLPNIVASSGPKYWGFVTGGTTPASIAGDWLTTVFDQNTQSTTGVGDCSALLELQVVNLLLDLFSLPDHYMGAFVTGATMANFTGLAVARQWYGQQNKTDIARDGLRTDIPVYAGTPHSSSIKAMAMLGMGSKQIIQVPLMHGREAMEIEALKTLLPADPSQPFILLASAGTVNTVDFDNFEEIAKLRQDYNFWLHIDAAFGAFAACSPAHAHLLNGWGQADSITIDFHKWLNVPYDSAMIFTRRKHATLQMQCFQNSAAPYLGNPAEQFSYLNFVPENSRRFRALPVWFTLMAYGQLGYRRIVEQSINLANQLADSLLGTGYFHLAAPVRLNTVCFTVNPDFADRINRDDLLHCLNETGKVFMTPTSYCGKSCIRAALVNYRTNPEDIGIAVEEIKSAVQKLLYP
ncbi:pyridoxal phosphate-dependent decarboxylase family protein [Flavihumibacter profundi]|jgi:glutamate/tyrosine decarboxylase-like PLP-dependent enzyme|uniref:pyridoxal phosphate-dependent decarboxylase family protein n=1 Tax=Flavihumibacter profundi TaxID=2716883 RepID=UPI001CC66E01|nr:pyridoxal-dependent decarboxylase [Flavihumibacter profundi]MBZ5856630.1 aspartate aminotransferase family protein [Flavihumibacter profundi]